MLSTWWESLTKWCYSAPEKKTSTSTICLSSQPRSEVFVAHALSRKTDVFNISNTSSFLSSLHGQPIFYSLQDCHDYARFHTPLFCCLALSVKQHVIVSDSKQLILHPTVCSCLNLTGLYRGWDKEIVRLPPPNF